MEDYWDDAEEFERDQLCQDHEGDEERDHDHMRELAAFDEMDPALAVMAEAQIGFSMEGYLYY